MDTNLNSGICQPWFSLVDMNSEDIYQTLLMVKYELLNEAVQ